MFAKELFAAVRGDGACTADIARRAADMGLVRIVPVEESPDLRIHAGGGSFGVVPTAFGLERLRIEGGAS